MKGWPRRNPHSAPAPVVVDRPIAPEDASLEAILDRCKPYTMTSRERMRALHDAVRYVEDAGIPGAIVECGVWRGGSSMVSALALLPNAALRRRRFYLYDTYAGMTAPTSADIDLRDGDAHDRWQSSQRADGANQWCYANVDEVRGNLLSTGYPSELMTFVEGPVERTIPLTIPDEISVLRLDTDWYESTKHELTWLYPRLAEGGVLLLDDYGHWRGARKATDEYFAEQQIHMLLHRIDYTGRIGVKR